MAKTVLGRGLSALMAGAAPQLKPSSTPPAQTEPADATPPKGERIRMVSLDLVAPCSFQPRKIFAQESIRELADSISQHGLIQPLVVREIGERYEIIAGERRWRACQLVGLAEIPVVVREAGDQATLELALIENLQREDLNPMDEASGYAQLISQHHLTQEQVATRLGKSRSTVANMLRLVQLEPSVQELLRSNKLTTGHAKAIASLPGFDQQKGLAKQIADGGLSVREAEAASAAILARPPGAPAAPAKKPSLPAAADPHLIDLRDKLQQKLGTKVTLSYAKGQGLVEIKFFSDDDLERILAILGIHPD